MFLLIVLINSGLFDIRFYPVVSLLTNSFGTIQQ